MKITDLFENRTVLNQLTKQIRDITVTKYGHGPSLYGHCEEVAGDLADMLIAAGYDGSVIHGNYEAPADESAITGHSWVIVDGMILDPTREQFGDDRLIIPIHSSEGKKYHPEYDIPFSEL